MPLQIPLEKCFLSNSPFRLLVPVNCRICARRVRFFLWRLLEGKTQLGRQRTQKGCACRSGLCWGNTAERGQASRRQHNLTMLPRPRLGEMCSGILARSCWGSNARPHLWIGGVQFQLGVPTVGSFGVGFEELEGRSVLGEGRPAGGQAEEVSRLGLGLDVPRVATSSSSSKLCFMLYFPPSSPRF